MIEQQYGKVNLLANRFSERFSRSFALFDADAEEAVTPEVEEGDGYLLEIAHFLKLVSGEKAPAITTPEQSLNSVKLVLAERQSAETRMSVSLS